MQGEREGRVRWRGWKQRRGTVLIDSYFRMATYVDDCFLYNISFFKKQRRDDGNEGMGERGFVKRAHKQTGSCLICPYTNQPE